MTDLQDNREIVTKKVAVNIDLLADLQNNQGREFDLEDEKRRNLSTEIDENLVYWDTLSQDIRLVLLDALDVRIEQDGEDVEDRQKFEAQNFKWDLIDYNKHYIYLQTHFDNP